MKKALRDFCEMTIGVFVATAVVFGAGLGSATSADLQDPGPVGCAVWSERNTNVAGFYQGYGLPWNVFPTSYEMLVDISCETAGLNLVVGNGAQSLYIWKDIYVSVGGSSWQKVSLQSPNVAGSWFTKRASAFVPDQMINQGDTGFVLFYTCQLRYGGWFCGCRTKNSCETGGLWQLQEIDLSRIGADIPRISSVSDETVFPEEKITLFGSGFNPEQKVFLEEYGSIGANVNDLGTEFVFSLPKDIPLGRYEVWVAGDGLESNRVFFNVKNHIVIIPKINRISDENPSPGSELVLYGSGFIEKNEVIVEGSGSISTEVNSIGTELRFVFPEDLTSGEYETWVINGEEAESNHLIIQVENATTTN